MKQKVQGIGGVFLKVKNPRKSYEWYANHLGVDIGDYGANFIWDKDETKSASSGTSWSLMKSTTDYFSPSERDVMINFRVNDLDAFLEQLKKDGVELVGEPESFDYGKFAWIIDPDGYKIELWEPKNEQIL